MASINVGKDPYPCFCGGSRTYGHLLGLIINKLWK